jgi:hypothetical protein
MIEALTMTKKQHEPPFGGIRVAIGVIGFVLYMIVLSWKSLESPFARGAQDLPLQLGEVGSIAFLITLLRVFKRRTERFALALGIAEFVLSGLGQLTSLSQDVAKDLRIGKLVIWLIILCLCTALVLRERPLKNSEGS